MGEIAAKYEVNSVTSFHNLFFFNAKLSDKTLLMLFLYLGKHNPRFGRIPQW